MTSGVVHDAAALLAAAEALFAADVVAARAATNALRTLLGASAEWQDVVPQLGVNGVVARHYRGTPAAILDQPGELVLVRSTPGRFLLLHRHEPHWRLIDRHGGATEIGAEALIEIATPAGHDTETSPTAAHVAVAEFDAVLIRLPHDESMALSAVSQLWPMLRAAWMEVGLSSLFVNGGLLLLPVFALLVYDKVVSNGVFETLWALVLGMLIYLLMDAGMRVVRNWSVERVAAELAERSDERLWQRLQGQTELSGGVASLLAEYRNLAAARDFVSANYLMGLADLPFFLLYLLVIGVIAWPLLVLVLTMALLYGLAGIGLQTRVNRLGKAVEQLGTAKLTLMSETLNALDVVRTAPAAHLLLRRWRAAAAATAGVEAQRRLATSHGSTLAVAMATLTMVATLTLGAYLIDARLLTVGGLIAVSMLATRTMALVASLFGLISKWSDFRRAAARIEASLAPVEERARVDKPTVGGRIDVLGLTRNYAGRPTALDNVTFAVASGERIALLGRPGSGKTTLMRCIAGLGRPDAGQILIDGVALSDIGRCDRVRWLAYKAQDPTLFAGTLDENLRVSGCRPDEPRFAQAIWASGLEDELRSGRMTLGMAIAERGGNLSGGQRQKVALARALAQESRIMLLDEPTLGLDPDGERQLAERLPQLLGDGVLIVSTHSAVLLSSVQRIIALDAGRIVADGPKERILRVGPSKVSAA